MVDDFSTNARNPLGHHQPLGRRSLSVLDLAYFFPTGLPDIEPIDEEVTLSTETSRLHRKSSPENAEPTSSSSFSSEPFFHQHFPLSESTLPQHYFSILESSLIQKQSSSKDSLPENYPSIFTANSNDVSNDVSNPKNISFADSRVGDLPPKVSLNSELTAIQQPIQTKASESESLQHKTVINSENLPIQNHNFSQNITSGETALNTTLSSEENFPHGHSFPEIFKSDNISPEVIASSGNSIIQKNSELDDSASKPSWPSVINSAVSADLDNHTSPETIIPDSDLIQTVLDGQSNTVENSVLSKEFQSEKTLSNSISDSQELVSKQQYESESKSIASDSGIIDNSSIQRLPSLENNRQENNIFGAIPSSVNANEDVQVNVPHSLKGDQNLASSLNAEESHVSAAEDYISKANQSQILSDFISENSVISAQSIESKKVSPTYAPTSQITTEISPLPETPVHTPISHDYLPVIVDFSTPPAPLQPQRMVDSRMVKTTNLLPETTEAELFTQTDSQKSEILLKSDSSQLEPSPSKSFHSIAETSSVVSTEIGLERVENSLTPTKFSAIDSMEIKSIQRVSESDSAASVGKELNSGIKSLNDETLTRDEDLAPENLIAEPHQVSIEKNSLLSSKDIAFPARNSAFSEVSLKFGESDSGKIQRNSESLSEWITDGSSSSSTEQLSDSKSVAEIELLSHQEVQKHSERDTQNSIEKISSSEVDLLKSAPSTDLEYPFPLPIRKATEEGSILSEESVATPTLQPFKTTTNFQYAENSLPGQPQQEINIDSTFSTDTTVSATLDTELSARTQSILPSHMQRTSEENSVPARGVESALIAKDSFSEAVSKGQMPLSSQVEKTGKAELDSSLGIAPKTPLFTEIQTGIEDSTPQAPQETNKEPAVLPLNEISTSPIEEIASNIVGAMESSEPDQIQKSSEPSFAFSVDSDLESYATDLVDEKKLRIQELSSIQVQRSSDEILASSTNISIDKVTVPEVKYLTQIDLDIEESVPKQIQKLGESSAISSTDIASINSRENLTEEPLVNINQTLFEQSQAVRESSPMIHTDTAPIPAISVLESQALVIHEHLLSQPVQKTAEDYAISSTLSTDLVSDSATTHLTETLLEIEKSIPKQIQKSNESSFTFLTDAVSQYNTENLADEPLVNTGKASFEQNQAIYEENTVSPVNAVPIPAITTLAPQTLVTAENLSSNSIQKIEEKHPTFLANVASETTEEALSTKTQPISIPEYIQRSSESSSIFSKGTSLIYQSDNSDREILTDIEISSPNNIQEANEVSFPHSTSVESLPAILRPDSKNFITTENTSPEQIQRTSQANHALIDIESAPKTDLVSQLNLGAEIARDLKASSLSQIQSIVEDDVILREHNIPVSEPTLREPQLLDHIEGELPRQIQRVAEDNTLSSADTLSEAEVIPSTSQDSACLQTRSDEKIQSAFEENTNFLTDDLSTSSKSDFKFELQADVRDISNQQIQRVVERDSSSLIDSYSNISVGDSIPKAESNLQISSPNQIYKINEGNSFSQTDYLSTPRTPSSEFKSFNDYQEALLQSKKDSDDTSLNHADLPSNTISKKVYLDSQPIFNAESLLSDRVQKSQGEESTVSADLSSTSSESILASKGLTSAHLVNVDGSLPKQIQQIDEKNNFDLGDPRTTTLSADLAPEFLSDIKEKSAEQVQKSSEQSSEFPSHATSSAQTTIPTPQKISVTGSEDEPTALELEASSKLAQNHLVIQQPQQTFFSSQNPSLENIQLHRNSDSHISLDRSSQILTSFLRPEILPDFDNKLSNTIQPSWDTKSSAPVSFISLPTAATPRSDEWRTIVGNSSEAFQEFSQAHLPSRPNSEGLLPDIIQKNSENKDIVELEKKSSASFYPAESLSNFENIQPHNIQTSDIQDFDKGSATVSAQTVHQHPMSISKTKAILPSQIQRVNEINFSADIETNLGTMPVVSSLASESVPQFQNFPFRNIQRTHDSYFDNLTSLSTNNPEFSENESPLIPNQEQSSTQDNSIYRFGDRTFPFSATSTFITNVLTPGNLLSAVNPSSNSIQRLSEGDSSISSDIESMHSALEAPSSHLLKSEELALDSFLDRNVSEAITIHPTSVDINAAQEQRVGKRLDQDKVIHETIKPLPTWPENLASSKDVGFHQTSENYETLPVVIDFQAPPKSLNRKAEIKQKAIENRSDLDTLMHREEETHLSASHGHGLDQSQDLLADADTTQDQENLGEAGIQSSLRATPTVQPQTDLLSRIHYSKINQSAQAPSADSELMEQSWFSQKTESDLSKPTQLSEIDDPMVQRLADDTGSVLPSEWQNLAGLVAFQTQDNSPPIQPKTGNIPKPILSQEIVEPWPNSSSVPLTTSSPLSTTSIQRKLSISRSKPVLKFRNPPSIQSQNTSNPHSSTPSFLIQAREDMPFTTIKANQNYVSEDHAGKTWALEQLAQEIYYRMRQRLIVEKERHGRLYGKRLK
jgi:hypothetical protein